jgi:3-hydroxymyristoyl/3-hydroxydecanoyl-(acyl carrier protein) dehydratase
MSRTLESEFTVAANHPALAGHFPGNPVVPAVVLLDAVLAAIRAHEACVLHSIPAVKFLKPVLPGERVVLRLELSAAEPARLRVIFHASHATSPAFEGSFIVAPGAAS